MGLIVRQMQQQPQNQEANSRPSLHYRPSFSPFVYGKLLLYCAISIFDHALNYAFCLFQHFPNPDTVMYNTLIRSLSHSPNPLSPLQPFIQLLRHPTLFPNSFSFAVALKWVANGAHFRPGIQLHSQALHHGFDSHIFVETTLVSMNAECGNYDSASQVFEEMSQSNVVAWNAIVTVCFRCGDVEGAWDLFRQMPIKNLTSWNTMLAVYAEGGGLGLATRVFNEMPLKK